MKAVKNPTEITRIRDAFLRDSIAMVHLLSYLEEHIDEKPTEFEIAELSTSFRKTYAHSFGDSFAPIVGFGRNAAIVHYSPEEGSSAPMGRDDCILMDTGGQYHWGTTDITRTLVVPSEPSLRRVSPALRSAFTSVLKGHITLARAQFPAGTRGVQLDTLARAPLWEQGLDFGHGTGHGVGYFSGVHEGPEVGAVVRNDAECESSRERICGGTEDGHADDGRAGVLRREAGIRHSHREHVPYPLGVKGDDLTAMVEETGKVSPTSGKPFLHFSHLSFVPIQASLCVKEMLTEEEKKWLQTYNQSCYDKLEPLIQDASVLEWLKRQAEETKQL